MFLVRGIEVVIEGFGCFLHFDAERAKAENTAGIFVSQLATSVSSTVFQLPGKNRVLVKDPER